MKFILSILMLSLLGLSVSCNRDNDGAMERQEDRMERTGDNLEDGLEDAGDNIEDGAEELDD
jgi:hypothetical protein